MTTTYKITLRGIPGACYAMYDDGLLKMFINELDKTANWIGLMPSFEMLQMKVASNTALIVQELKGKSAADKIALFTFHYKKHKGIACRVTKEERANIVNVTVNEQLLNAYFTATQYPLAGLKSIGDYIRHYNEIRDLATNGRPLKSQSFPDVYDREYERGIGDNSPKLERYWAHLRSLGFKKQDGTWIKA